MESPYVEAEIAEVRFVPVDDVNDEVGLDLAVVDAVESGTALAFQLRAATRQE